MWLKSRVDIVLSHSLKFKYILDIAICEQNMATNSVNKSRQKLIDRE